MKRTTGFLCASLCASICVSTIAVSACKVLALDSLSPGLAETPGIISADTPAQISIDFSKEGQEFKAHLFGVMDAPLYDKEGYQLIKNGRFGLVAMSQKDLGFAKSKQLEEGQYEIALIYVTSHVIKKGELQKDLKMLFKHIDRLKKKNPRLKINTFLFSVNPDLFESVSDDDAVKLFQAYAVFAKEVKIQNNDASVGGLNFVKVNFPTGQQRIKEFIEFAGTNEIPLDVISFEEYSFGTDGFLDAMGYIQLQLARYPALSPLYGTAKVALTGFDMQKVFSPDATAYPQMATAWKAAHNGLALLALADKGLWMSYGTGGPFADFKKDRNILWVEAGGRIKPVYYAHKALNALSGMHRVGLEGCDFKTFGVLAGKSAKQDALTIVIAGYDRQAFLTESTWPGIPDDLVYSVAKEEKISPPSSYSITIRNLPWIAAQRFTFERYIVDDAHSCELVEAAELKGSPEIVFKRPLSSPQVQLIKIYRK